MLHRIQRELHISQLKLQILNSLVISFLNVVNNRNLDDLVENRNASTFRVTTRNIFYEFQRDFIFLLRPPLFL